ncbi:MAG: DUF1501 domain-containing protein [Planctomycetales bacterium]|nr:DUF1501 domain-containing protein [Planctomycetales bacterium]
MQGLPTSGPLSFIPVPRTCKNTGGIALITRRKLLTQGGMGLGSLALANLLAQEGSAARANPLAGPIAKAKSVIWLFMIGGASHLESFDYKPALNKYQGKSVDETPFAQVLKSPYLANERVVAFDPNNGFIRTELYPLQTAFRQHGQSGLHISDWFPHLAQHADELCVVRSMWTEDSNHGAQLQFHTGRHRVDGFYPTIGSWVNYGLGSLNENLPQFVVMGTPVADCCGGMETHRANYLGPQYDGIPLKVDPADPLPFARPPAGVFREEQLGELGLLRKLNHLTAQEFPDDPAIEARIKSYELAYRMQMAVPEVVDFAGESQETLELYGIENKTTKVFGEQMLTARRLVERGVRFIQVYHGSNGGAGRWDAHRSLKSGHTTLCGETDQPIAALLSDLRRRGLLEETLVVWATEFGRTPGSQLSDGRDHHPYGFSIWLAGGGIQGGLAHGATDEIGFHAVENRHYVTDLHATVLHQMGIDHRSLNVPGRQRLERDYGTPIYDILS